MMIKNLGIQVEDVWKNLRPMTKKMLVGVMETNKKKRKPNFSYDAHADWELSRLLTALDKESVSSKVSKDTGNLKSINHLAEVCANVLEEKTESAEIFIQLAKRALAKNNYFKIDELSDILLGRFLASEVAEVVRQTDTPQIKAIAYETLAVMSVSVVAPLVKDPLYFEIACTVLEQQAVEFENEQARITLEQMSASFGFGSDLS